MGILSNFDYIFEVIIGVLIILLTWNIVLAIALHKSKKKLRTFTDSGEIVDLEQVIVNYKDTQQLIEQRVSQTESDIFELKSRTKLYKGNVELIRYNAFDQAGQELSYSVAFLDENADGVIISSIYAQAGSNSYAKPIKGGVSEHKLSPEEQAVLERAQKK